MKKRSFERLLSQIEKLTPTQSKQLKNTLKQQYSEKQLATISKEIDLILNNFTQSEKEYIINKKSYIDKNMTIDFKKEKTNFQNGYNKLLDLCQKQNTDKL